MSASRILVVDDEEQHFNLLKTCLSPMGFELEWIDCMEDIISKIDEGNFDVLILDYLMPRKNGLIIAEEVRKKKHLKEFPIILLTSKRLIHEETKKMGECKVHYMRKPFIPQILSAKLRELLGRSAG